MRAVDTRLGPLAAGRQARSRSAPVADRGLGCALGQFRRSAEFKALFEGTRETLQRRFGGVASATFDPADVSLADP
jgi:hypothetical protein